MHDDDIRDLIEWQQRAEKAQETLRQWLADWIDDDTAIRNLCRPVLGSPAVDWDYYGATPIVEVVRMTIEKLMADQWGPVMSELRS